MLFYRIEPHIKWALSGLFLWWSLAVFSLTFCDTYVRTGNSYFACWGAWAASGRALLEQFPALKGYADLDFGGPDGEASAPEVSPTVFGSVNAPIDFGSPTAQPEVGLEEPEDLSGDERVAGQNGQENSVP